MTRKNMKQEIKSIDSVTLEIHFYPVEVTVVRYHDDDISAFTTIHRGFYFNPRIFKAGSGRNPGVTDEGLRVATDFVYEKLAQALKDANITVELFFPTYLSEELENRVEETKKMLRMVIEKEFNYCKLWQRGRYIRFSTVVKNFEELKKFYNKLHLIISLYTEPSIAKEIESLIYFDNPIMIKIPKEEIKTLYERLLQTDAQLNSITAYALFGEEFAQRVIQHNREVRQRRKQKTYVTAPRFFRV